MLITDSTLPYVYYLSAVAKLKDSDTVVAYLQCTHALIPEVFMGINFHKIILPHKSTKVSFLSEITSYMIIHEYLDKTSGSELRGQEEAACMRVFRPTRPLPPHELLYLYLTCIYCETVVHFIFEYIQSICILMQILHLHHL